MNAGDVVFTFKGDTSELEDKTKKASTSVGDIIKGSLASKAISLGIQTLTSNLDDAIKRVDQLDQFPRVMNSLGISTKEANEALKQVDKSIIGLPTTLNQAAQGVQRLTAKNEDVKLSATYFTAMNDALLSGTNDTTLYNSALEQMLQAYSKGKPDLIEFKSWLNAMPGQLKAVAKEMGFASTDDLYTGFKEGTVNMNDFMNALVKLDTEGSGNMASFSEQAKANTSGIQTSIANLKTAIVRGLGDSIRNLNKSLEENNLPTFSEMIQKLSKSITKFFKKITPVITFIIKHSDVFGPLAKGVLTFASALKVGIDVVKLMHATLTLTGGPIVWIIALIAGVVVALVTLYNKCEWFRNGVNAVLTFIGNIFSTISNGIKAVVGLFVADFQLKMALVKATFQILGNVFSSIGNAIVGVFNWLKSGISSIISGINSIFWSFINFVASIPGKIVGFFASIPNKMFNVGKNLLEGLWNGINNAFSWVIDKIKGIGNKILKTIKKIFGVHSPSTEFAWIGKMNMVGLEEGMEDMQPKIQSAIDGMFNLSPSLIGSASTNLSPNISVINNVSMETDPLGQVVKKIKTFSGGAKNDYNYGMGA